MVKKLRRKFVKTAMLSLLLILIAIIGVINIVNFVQIQSTADETLGILSENDGFFPDMNRDKEKKQENTPPDGKTPDMLKDRDMFPGGKAAYIRALEMPFQSRYFWVRMSSDGDIKEINTGHIAAISSTEASTAATSVYSTPGKTKGYYEHHYRYLIHKTDDGSVMILFLDCSNDFYGANRLLITTLLIGLVALVGMFVLVYLFSGKAVAPVVESLEKQKRFITDAGHELKTPLAVISANVDVIELESGKSEWTTSTKNQIKRMNGLVKNMLTLSRMEEENIHLVFSEIDMSKVISDCADTFSAVAESKGLNYNKEILDDLHIMGDKNSITQLASLLIDNAMKYSSENGSVNVRLSTDNRKKHVIFEVSNTCDSIPEGNLDRLFDRFYRADSSRSRETGGYGIGLSVARAIATSHGGSIEAKRDGDKIIRFVAEIPLINKAK